MERTHNPENLTHSTGKNSNKIVSGPEYWAISLLMALDIMKLALLTYKNPWKAFHSGVRAIKSTRNYFKITHPKMIRLAKKYYIHLYSPGWPSKAFKRSIHHSFNLLSHDSDISLHTLVFAVTNKCGFQCEHCVEWDVLNKKDKLSASGMVDIINRFHRMGVAQVYFSGGEPLNRLDDILFILDSVPEGIDFWMFTNGYSLSADKAARLKKHGLKGVIISLDHYDRQKHDQFRGVRDSYKKALQSARHVVDQGLLLAFSCCATNDFISSSNLMAYAKLCRDAGASFIHFLEPEPVGHYKQKNVSLLREKKDLLENFFQLMNFDSAYSGYPVVSYPALFKNQNGCPGRGLYFVYVDSDGDVQACPFCKSKLFPASISNLQDRIGSLREEACPNMKSVLSLKDQNEIFSVDASHIPKKESIH